MRVISRGQLRRRSARVLREVAAGESVLVTHRGQVIAQIGPPRIASASMPRVLSGAKPVRRFPTRVQRDEPTQHMIDVVRDGA